MNPRTNKILVWVGGILGGGLGLAILGFAMQFWISINVKAQLDEITIPDTAQLITDVEVIKSSINNIETNIGTVTASKQRFEEIFIEYLAKEASR